MARIPAQRLLVPRQGLLVAAQLPIGLGQLEIVGGLRRLMPFDERPQPGRSGLEVRPLVDLGRGQQQLVVRRGRQLGRVVQRDLAAVARLVILGGLLERRQELGGGRRTALDLVVGHDRLDDVLGPALGHVAAGAVSLGVAGVLGAGERRGVAGAADGVVGLLGVGAAPRLVRIVTARAAQAVAPAKALRLQKAIAVAGDLELVLTDAVGVVEVQHEVRQRLTGLVGESAALEAHDGVGSRRLVDSRWHCRQTSS